MSTLLLAVETSTARSSVALATSDGILAATQLGRDRRHGEFLAPALRDLLDHAGCGMGDLTHVAAGIGPGLYTGLRVGLVTASTIAATLDLPCVGIAGPDVIAHRVRHTHRRIVVALDARRSEVYLGQYEPGGDGVARAGELGVGTVEEAAAALGDHLEPVLLVGDAAAAVAEQCRRMAAAAGHDLDLQLGASDTAQPTAADLAPLALAAAEAGRVGGVEVLRPLYLREADARIGWDERGRLQGGAAS